MINGSAVCFLDGGKLKGRRGEEEKKSKYIFNVIKNGHLNAVIFDILLPPLVCSSNFIPRWE